VVLVIGQQQQTGYKKEDRGCNRWHQKKKGGNSKTTISGRLRKSGEEGATTKT